jgi:23S rRNA (guanine745-N1)-methyltransferase
VVGTLELDVSVGVPQLVEGENLHRPTIRHHARVLGDVVDLLRCPVCGDDLTRADAALRCPSGHSFDIARQGYVNLVPGRGDTAEMVEARDLFLRAGHFRPLTAALAAEATQVEGAAAVLDLGTGTGHQLAAVLDALPDAHGIALDASPAALRRAARCHERAAAVGADAWKPLPLKDRVAALVLSVFAPRNAAEMARVLAPGDAAGAPGNAGAGAGRLLAVTPTTRHLHELVGPLGLLSVPDDKEDRLDEQLSSDFTLAARRTIEHAMFLTRDECAQIVRMGPSAWHADEQSVAEGLALLPDPLTVTASMTLSRYVRART